ncbi:HWE histidine kinase domain-containing protein [Plastorhodobacter daqingensis]|uniref:histidine kinase n=1 Tax=Plastorhodobacter daqingensis TaxID=1387281 RepID=A0ABW2UKK7_9RHOB
MTQTTIIFTETGGPVAQAIRNRNWSRSALGPAENWPEPLRQAVQMMIDAPLPQFLTWQEGAAGKEAAVLFNDAFSTSFGHEAQMLGQTPERLWGADWGTVAQLTRGALDGRAAQLEDAALHVRRSDAPGIAFFTVAVSPLRGTAGRIDGTVGTLVPTTVRVTAEQQARLRNRELLHRIKNIFAIVTVIVQQSCRGAATVEAVRDQLSRRLRTLDQAQRLLMLEDIESACIHDVVHQSLAPFRQGRNRITLSGPRHPIGGRQVLALALALNELAANATKYGALSRESGRIDLRWRLDSPAQHLRLVWRESGGPPVAPPAEQGFGSFLIRQSLAAEFGGTVELAFLPDGLRCELRAGAFPGHRSAEPAPAADIRPDAQPPDPQSLRRTGAT